MNNLNPESYDRMYTYREDRIVHGQSMHWDIPLEQRPMPRLQSQQREVFLVRASLFFINSIATIRLLKQKLTNEPRRRYNNEIRCNQKQAKARNEVVGPLLAKK